MFILLAQIPKKGIAIKWGVIQSIFAVIMALGFRELVQGTYDYLRPILGIPWRGAPSQGLSPVANPFVYFLPTIALAFLGIRFFWATVNVRRYVDRLNENLRQAEEVRKEYERKIVLVHIPILILHGFIFYFCCHLAEDLLFASQPVHAAAALVFVYASFLIVNAVWLWLLTRDYCPNADTVRERYWGWNNLVCSCLGTSLLLITFKFDWRFDYLLAIICSIFILSSLLDLYFTSYHYLEVPE